MVVVVGNGLVVGEWLVIVGEWLMLDSRGKQMLF